MTHGLTVFHIIIANLLLARSNNRGGHTVVKRSFPAMLTKGVRSDFALAA